MAGSGFHLADGSAGGGAEVRSGIDLVRRPLLVFLSVVRCEWPAGAIRLDQCNAAHIALSGPHIETGIHPFDGVHAAGYTSSTHR